MAPPRLHLRPPGMTLILLALVLPLPQCFTQTYTFDQDIYIVHEGTDATASVMVIRDPVSSGTASIHVATGDRTAIAGRDYAALSITLYINSHSTSFDVPIRDDPFDRGALRCFTVTLSSPTPSATLPPASLVCIIEDDNVFGGTCPPPEALHVIEYNAEDNIDEPVIEKSVVNDQIAVFWTEPSVATGPVVQNCYMIDDIASNYVCSSGELFPITDTLVDYGDRIFLELINFIPPMYSVSVRCEFYLRVKDEVPPEITCPSNVTEIAGSNSQNAMASWTAPIGTDNSLVADTSGTHSSPMEFNIGTHEVIYTVVDPTKNTNNCKFFVIIDDDTPPVLACPGNMIIPTDPGESFAIGNYKMQLSLVMSPVDNSEEDLSAVGTPPSESKFDVGDNEVNLTATDSHGNVGWCVFYIIVEDDERPLITCPDNETISTDNSSSMATYELPSATASDNTVNYTITIDVNGTTESEGSSVSLNLTDGFTTTHLLMYTAADYHGNSESCTLNVTLIDEVPPEITCPSNVTEIAGSNSQNASANWTAPIGTDNSLVANTSGTHSSPMEFNIGTHEVNYTVVDPSGNTNNCKFFVIIDDDTPPVLECPGNMPIPTDPGESFAIGNYTTQLSLVTPVDNSQEDLSAVGTPPSESKFDVGDNEVNLTATDSHGNVGWCVFYIIVEDDERPLITCPDNETISTDNSSSMATYELPSATASDNTVNYTITIDVNGTTESEGSSVSLNLTDGFTTTHLLVYTAADYHGNSESCTLNVTVIDEEPPVLTCPEDITSNLDEGLSTAIVTFAIANVTDNSQEESIAESNITSGSTFEYGETVVGFTAEDLSNNIGRCSFIVTVKDIEKPVFVDCANVTFSTSPGLSTADVTYYRPNATDNVAVMSVNCLPLNEAGGTLSVGFHEITCIARDKSELIDTCMFHIIVEDDERPLITCPDNETISTDNSSSMATYELPSATASDNTVNYTITIDVNGTTESEGSSVSLNLTDGFTTTHLLVYTAADYHGNSESCTLNVTVIDEEPPVLTCPEDITSNLDEGLSTAIVTFAIANVTDNSQEESIAESNITSGSTFEYGETVVGFTAEDLSNNIGRCSFIVTVKDIEKPVFVDCANVTFSTSPGLSTADVTYYRPNATDNVAVMSVNCLPLNEAGGTLSVGFHEITCIARDKSELIDTCMFHIIVEDDERPLITCPDNETISTDNSSSMATYELPSATASDNTVNYTITIDVNGTTESEGSSVSLNLTDGFTTTHLLVYTAADYYGNSESCTLNVTVIDEVPPEITCPSNVTEIAGSNSQNASANWTAPIGTDNSLVANTSGTHSSPMEFNIGTHEVNYTVVDLSGNTNNCKFFVIIDDDTPPVLECPGNMIIPTDPGESFAIGNYTMQLSLVMSPVDNSQEDLSAVGTPPSESKFDVGDNEVNLTATDSHGNVGWCVFYIIVEDDERPLITCPDNETISTDNSSSMATYELPSAMASDNTVNYTITIDVNGTTESEGSSVSLNLTDGFTTTHLLVYTAADYHGNSESCTLNVTVIDDEPPELICPPGQIEQVSDNMTTTAVTWPPPLVSDNSGLLENVSSDIENGSDFQVGYETTVTYTAYDISGNSADCNFTVFATDNVKPTIFCPENITEGTDLNKNYTAVSWDQPTIMDNVPTSVTYNADHENGANFEIGDYLVTLTAFDAYRNNASCQFSIAVTDEQDPLFLDCPSDSNVTTVADEDYGLLNGPEPSAWDNSGSVTVVGPRLPEQFPIGLHSVLFIAVDAAAGIAVCAFSVLVLDEQSPRLRESYQCPTDIVVYSDMQVSNNATVTWAMPEFEDNSGASPVVTVTPPGPVFQLGNTTVTIRAEDASGNPFECVFQVTVEMYDMAPPAWSQCPPSTLTVETDPDSDVVWPYDFGITVNDSGSGVETADLTAGQPLLIGPNEVVLRAVDYAGNIGYCNFTITVLDNQKPNITACPENATVIANGDAGGSFSWQLPSAVDNTGGIEVICTHQPGTPFALGDNPVVCTATDASNNTASCSFSVTVQDDMMPSFVGCPFQAVTNSTGLQSNTGVAFWPEPQPMDNVAVASVQSNYKPGATFPLGPTLVTYNVTDTSGLVGECSFTVLIEDEEPPVIECPDGVNVTIFNHQLQVVVDYPQVNATDYGSGVASLSCTRESGTLFQIGYSDVTCFVLDVAKNLNHCIFKVIVSGVPDTVPPEIKDCPDNTTLPADNTTSTTIVSWTPPSVADNSGGDVDLAVDIQPWSPFGIGVTRVTYTATDPAGLVSECVFFVTILDHQLPDILDCPVDINQTTDANKDTAAVDWPSPGASDNSGQVDLQASAIPGQEFEIGVTVVTYTATDLDNNVRTCSFNITVTDEEKPGVTGCPSESLMRYTEPGQNYSLVTWDPLDICDNSGAWNVIVTGPKPGPIEVGVYEVAYIVEDPSGNTEECQFTVQVIDMERPEFTNCPTSIIQLVGVSGTPAEVTWANLTVTDNVGVNFTSLNGSHASNDTFPFGGPTDVVFSVQDVSGNINFCRFTVTVSDDSLAVSNCPVHIRVPNDPGINTSVVVWDAPDVQPEGQMVNVSSLPYSSGDTIPLGRHNISHTISNLELGNASCEFVVEVVDGEPPTWAVCPSAVQASSVLSGATVAVDFAEPTAEDNSGTVVAPPGSHSPGSNFSVGETTVTYAASDLAGHEINCTFVVTVPDDDPPELTCPPHQEVFTDLGRGTATLLWPEANATDNVGVSWLVSDPLNGSPLVVGQHLITYTAADGQGNENVCTFNITVTDNEDPVFRNCPNDVTEVAPQDQATAVVAWDLPSASDNAVAVHVVTLQQSSALYPLGVSPVLYLATDAAGNTANCSFDVIVLDEQVPEFTFCPSDFSRNTTLGQSTSASVVWTEPTATDNDPSLNLTSDVEQPATLPYGSNLVTYMARDRAGNKVNCSFTVTVIDWEDPTFDGCPGSIGIPADKGTTTTTVTWTPPTASDNVAVSRSASTHEPNTAFSLGTVTVVYTATDAEGNVGECTFDITVLDSNAPLIANCPTDQSFCADNDTLTRDVSWIEPTASDGEGAVTLASDFSPGATFHHNGGTPTVVTYTAVDESGLNASCSFSVTVRDCQKPVFADCPADITMPGSSGVRSNTVYWTEPTATDNSNQVDLSSTHSPGDTFYFTTSPTPVQYTAVDPSGNTETCTFQVSISDTTKPVLSGCPSNQSIFTDTDRPTGSATWTPPTLTSQPNDPATLTETHLPGSDFPIGTEVVTYTGTDSSGNEAHCQFWITVTDNQPPTITNCPTSFMLYVASETDQATASWTAPTANDNSGQVTLTAANVQQGQQLSPGQYDVTQTAIDPAGLTAPCPTFTIVVQINGTGCNTNPCQNGGSCISPSANGFICTCTSFWTGNTCAEDLNECQQVSTNQQCVNQGLVCFNQLLGSTCRCPILFAQAGQSTICRRGRNFRFVFIIVEIFREVARAVFTSDLSNPNSVAFLTHQGRLQSLLAVVFRGLGGFVKVDIVLFSDGSIKVDAVATFDPDSSVTQADVDRALQQAITSGDLLMGSEYKLTPSRTQVIEELCQVGHCLNGGTCTVNTIDYLSTCTCPPGFAGSRCENTDETSPSGGDGLSTEVIVAIAIGAAVLLFLLLMIPLCAYIVAARGRRSRSDYLYREDYERQPHYAKRHQNGSGYDFQFGTNGAQSNVFMAKTSQFSIPYLATGTENPMQMSEFRQTPLPMGNPIHLFPMERDSEDYF